MKAGILGVGWITPLGRDVETVWKDIRAGAVAATQPVTNPETGRVLQGRPVPPDLVQHLGRNPRLRRSSVISYFAVSAALDGIANAGLEVSSGLRTTLVFAVSNGGVQYTRRFYDQIAKQGANAASPLLFPETVYNAPASHLSATLGLDLGSYTLVGDSSIGLTALHFAAQLLATGECDRAVVVGCEELDWILCEAFRDWRLIGVPLSEGAAAVVLGAEGGIPVEIADGVPFARRREAGAAMERALGRLSQTASDGVVSSGNDGFGDRIESEALAKAGIDAPSVRIKASLGEAPGASALWQVVAATAAIRHDGLRSVLVPAVGSNHQAVVARLTRD